LAVAVGVDEVGFFGGATVGGLLETVAGGWVGFGSSIEGSTPEPAEAFWSVLRDLSAEAAFL